MMSPKLPKKPLWKFAATVLALSALSWLLERLWAPGDARIFRLLMIAFGADEKSLLRLPCSDFADATFLFLAGSASVAAGYTLTAVPRVLAWFQIFVLSILVEWLLLNFFHIQTRPLEILFTLLLGLLGGYALRRLSLGEKRAQAQYYELMLRNKELQETRLHMVKQDEIDRRMLAADLHDQVLNDLKAIKLKIEKYGAEPDPELAANIEKLLKQAMGEIREVMDSLSPSALEHLGLAQALEDCFRRGSERGGFKVRFKNKIEDEDSERLSKVEQTLLYRLVQESITNICKHAAASVVRGSVDKEDQQLVIRIVDDGKGIENDKIRQDSRGLRYMRQRADLIGATIAWRQGDEGKGTAVEIRVDLKERNDDARTDR